MPQEQVCTFLTNLLQETGIEGTVKIEAAYEDATIAPLLGHPMMALDFSETNPEIKLNRDRFDALLSFDSAAHSSEAPEGLYRPILYESPAHRLNPLFPSAPPDRPRGRFDRAQYREDL